MRPVMMRRLLAGAGLCLSASACTDPLQQDLIAALGDETPGVARGPLHRAGQPCLVCHDGAEATELAVAGTAYRLADAAEPIAGALVQLIDSTRQTYEVATNCAGNFFVRPGDYTPRYPMWVRVEHAGWLQEMESPIHGEGSCAACHESSPGPRSAGPVYLLPFEDGQEGAGCP